MNPMMWLAAGMILGCLTCIELGTDRREDVYMNVASGLVGAFLAGWLATAPFGVDALRAEELSWTGLVLASLGALVLLAIVNLIRLARDSWRDGRAEPEAQIRNIE